jgi:hypothetical protein
MHPSNHLGGITTPGGHLLSPLKHDDSDINMVGVGIGGTGSMRISHCSPGLSPGEEVNNEQHLIFVYEMN